MSYHEEMIQMEQYNEILAMRQKLANTPIDLDALVKTVSELKWRLEQEERRTNQLTDVVKSLQSALMAHMDVPHMIYGETNGKTNQQEPGATANDERAEVAG